MCKSHELNASVRVGRPGTPRHFILTSGCGTWCQPKQTWEGARDTTSSSTGGQLSLTPSLKNKPAREEAGRQSRMFVQTLISSRTLPLGLCNVCWMVYVGVGGPVGCITGASRRRMCSARLLSADSQDEPKDAAQPGCYFGLIYL